MSVWSDNYWKPFLLEYIYFPNEFLPIGDFCLKIKSLISNTNTNNNNINNNNINNNININTSNTYTENSVYVSICIHTQTRNPVRGFDFS